MHDLVLRSSLLYVYGMIYEILAWGYDGKNMGILVGLERGSLDEGTAHWLR
jgi:hypothetical protein